MTSPITYPMVEDRDLLDDVALWAVIDSAVKSHSLKRYNPYTSPTPTPNKHKHKTPPFSPKSIGEVVVPTPTNSSVSYTVRNVAMSQSSVPTSPMSIVQRKSGPISPSPSPCYGNGGGGGGFESESNVTPTTTMMMSHSLLGRFPSVALFKEYQTAALEILEKSDYTLISGSPFIKKTGWRKISCYFNISYEIKDRTIDFDDDRNVQRAEFVVRAYMHGGRFSDGWGSCDRREKRFMKPNNDIPSTAETRAKNKACQDLLGIGGPGAKRA